MIPSVCTEAEVRAALSSAIQRAGSLREWARRNDLSAAYVSDVMRHNRSIGEKIARALGYQVRVERTTRYIFTRIRRA